jgi:hypothetical protein
MNEAIPSIELITANPKIEELTEPKTKNSIQTINNKMPDIIKKNFIYRKVHNEVFEKDSNATFIIIGKPGMGKSVIAQKMCLDLDPSFSQERICYDIESFLDLLDKGDSNGELKPGNCILFDEIVTDKGADSRSAMSKTNKIMNYVTATFRAKRIVVFYCLPSLTQLDKNIRDINITGIFEILHKSIAKRKNYCKFTWSKYNARTQKAYYVYPRLINKKGQVFRVKGVCIGLPPYEFEEEYKKKKMSYLKSNIARWNASIRTKKKTKSEDEIKDEAIISAIRMNPSEFIMTGRYNAFLIKEKFKLGIMRAGHLSGFLNKELKERYINSKAP